jgi:hypothetical protein
VHGHRRSIAFEARIFTRWGDLPTQSEHFQKKLRPAWVRSGDVWTLEGPSYQQASP